MELKWHCQVCARAQKGAPLATHWNTLSAKLRNLSVGSETFAKHSKMHLFRVGFSHGAHRVCLNILQGLL